MCEVRGLENPAKDEAVDSLMSDDANSLISVRSGNPLNGRNHSFGELSHRLAVWRSELHRFFPPQLLKFWKLFEHICDFESLPIAVINLSQLRFNLHFNAVVGSNCFCSLTSPKEGAGVNCCYANILESCRQLSRLSQTFIAQRHIRTATQSPLFVPNGLTVPDKVNPSRHLGHRDQNCVASLWQNRKGKSRDIFKSESHNAGELKLEGLALPKVTVLVRLKASLDDAQGRVVERALRNLGYDKVQKVRIGKLIEVWLDENVNGDEAKQQVEAMCRQLLANPVVEEFEVRIDL